jgi:hypothetical protein
MNELPGWLDAPKIAGLAVLTLMFVQYFKAQIPDKWIKVCAVLMGITLSILCEIYIGATPSMLNWVKAIVNGAVAAVISDTAYKFLSNSKSPSFTLPSKVQETGEKKP